VLALVSPLNAQAGTITITNVQNFTGVHTEFFFTDFVYPSNPTSPFYDADKVGQPFPLAQRLGSVSMSGGVGLNDALNYPNEFDAYCADFLAPIDFSATAGVGLDYTAFAAEMSDWQAPTALNSAEARQRASWLYITYADTFDETQLLERTALQLAIWEVLYDEQLSLDLGEGRLYVSDQNPDVRNKATEYLTALQRPENASDVAASNAAWIQLSLGDDQSIQDFIGPVAATAAVPEPSAGLLLGMGVMSLAAFRSRKTLFRRA
jgi:hypothetical protein